MKLENFKDLEKAIKICRRNGVESIRIDNIEFKLGLAPEAPTKAPELVKELTVTSPTTLETQSLNVKTWEEMTDEERLFYSVQEQYVKNV